MQKFTKTEIEWIIDELDRAVVDLKQQAIKEENAGFVAGFMNLRSEQLSNITDKLRKAIVEGSKRIEITY